MELVGLFHYYLFWTLGAYISLYVKKCIRCLQAMLSLNPKMHTHMDRIFHSWISNWHVFKFHCFIDYKSLNSQLNLYTSPAHSRLLKKCMMNEIKPFMQCHSEWRNWHHWQILTSIVSSKMRSSHLIIGYIVRSFFLNCLFTSSLLIIMVWNIQHYKEIYGTDFNLSFRACISAYL